MLRFLLEFNVYLIDLNEKEFYYHLFIVLLISIFHILTHHKIAIHFHFHSYAVWKIDSFSINSLKIMSLP